MDRILSLLEGMDVFSLLVVFGSILAALHMVPNIIKKLGISKLGPLEMEHRNQSNNYETNRKIEIIDIDNRENLWEMTEDLFSAAADASTLGCDAAVGYILHGVSDPIRTMVLLNHIAPKLVKHNEVDLRARITRGISRALKDARTITQKDKCPVSDDIAGIPISKYDSLIDNWINRARAITSQACEKKIQVYEAAIENNSDKHWKDIYKNCINKNRHYIKGMGHEDK